MAVISACSVPSRAEMRMDSLHASTASSAIGLIVDCRFDSANAIIDSFVGNAPEEPLGYLLTLSLIGLRDLDYESIAESKEFENTYVKLRGILDSDSLRGTSDSYQLTMSGFADATYASYCLRRKRYREGVRIGLSALGELKEAKKKNPGNADVDFFLGLYECAKAELKQKLWWVLFWYSGSTEEGIARLERCRTDARFASLGAVLALADVYTTEGLYDRSERVIDSTWKLFPRSRFIRWSRARLFEARGEWGKATAEYRFLLEQYRAIPEASRNAAATQSRLANALFQAGDRAGALTVCDSLIGTYSGHDAPHFEELVKETRKLRNEIVSEG